MRKPLSASVAVLTACLMAVPAVAAPTAASKDLGLQAGNSSLLLQVQHRHGGHYHGGGGDAGAAAAAGLIGGLFLGAVVASEAQRQQRYNYCAQRFRSFDPGSMTYVGRDGRRHSCP